jgi:hypothetical protein
MILLVMFMFQHFQNGIVAYVEIIEC